MIERALGGDVLFCVRIELSTPLGIVEPVNSIRIFTSARFERPRHRQHVASPGPIFALLELQRICYAGKACRQCQGQRCGLQAAMLLNRDLWPAVPRRHEVLLHQPLELIIEGDG